MRRSGWQVARYEIPREDFVGVTVGDTYDSIINLLHILVSRRNEFFLRLAMEGLRDNDTLYIGSDKIPYTAQHLTIIAVCYESI